MVYGVPGLGCCATDPPPFLHGCWCPGVLRCRCTGLLARSSVQAWGAETKDSKHYNVELLAMADELEAGSFDDVHDHAM